MEITIKYVEHEEVPGSRGKKLAIIGIDGEIIGDGRFKMNNALTEAASKDDVMGIIIDMQKVPMMDSVGLGMITASLITLRGIKKKLVLLNVGRSVRYLLVVTKLDYSFEKYDDEKEAVKACLGLPAVNAAGITISSSTEDRVG